MLLLFNNREVERKGELRDRLELDCVADLLFLPFRSMATLVVVAIARLDFVLERR
jgi:hypothetical protein